MAFSLLRRPSPRLPLAVALLSRLSPPPSPPLHNSHLLSTHQPLPPPAKSQQDKINLLFRSFVRSPWAIDQALSLYLAPYAFSSAVNKFRLNFLSRHSPQTADRLLEMADTLTESSLHRLMLLMFTKFYMKELSDDIPTNKKLLQIADLTKPHLLYPFARSMKRKVIYHYGPTNSGKTYAALNRFAQVERGVYCGPLRLLASEVAEKMNNRGVACSLLTGHEMNIIPSAGHTACTVEMTSFTDKYDVAILDEIQMMSDPTRGYYWTRALLGLRADEIHLCGDASALWLVQEICIETKDQFEEYRYERFAPLDVELETLRGDLTKVRSGDCVIVFPRRDIFQVKYSIEKFTSHKCCLVYGNLPPEIRRHQASLFNDKNNVYDILIASDAVGMGLNLEIRRVIFHALSKFNGKGYVPLSSSQVKQIAGRAGRRGSTYPQGSVTTFMQHDINYLLECLEEPIQPLKRAGIFPSLEKLEYFASYLPKVQFGSLVKKFMGSAKVGDKYFVCEYDNELKIGNAIEQIPGLSIIDRIKLCFAPIEKRDPLTMKYLLRFASCYSKKVVADVPPVMPTRLVNEDQLGTLESQYQVLMLYVWFSRRFEETYFPEAKRAKKMAAVVASFLKRALVDSKSQVEVEIWKRAL